MLRHDYMINYCLLLEQYLFLLLLDFAVRMLYLNSLAQTEELFIHLADEFSALHSTCQYTMKAHRPICCRKKRQLHHPNRQIIQPNVKTSFWWRQCWAALKSANTSNVAAHTMLINTTEPILIPLMKNKGPPPKSSKSTTRCSPDWRFSPSCQRSKRS